MDALIGHMDMRRPQRSCSEHFLLVEVCRTRKVTNLNHPPGSPEFVAPLEKGCCRFAYFLFRQPIFLARSRDLSAISDGPRQARAIYNIMQSASEYLASHNVEAKIAAGIAKLVLEKPAKPCAALGSYLIENSTVELLNMHVRPLEMSNLVMGGAWLAFLNSAEQGQEVADAAVAAAVDAGILQFDTAPLYGAGVRETRLGAAVGKLPPAAAAKVRITTKAGRLLREGRVVNDFTAEVCTAPSSTVHRRTDDPNKLPPML